LFSALLPLLANAQAWPPIETPDEVRASFVDAGYPVDAPTTWWTNGSTTFLVHDPLASSSPLGRVVMVLVYPDLTTAHTERQNAQTAAGEDATLNGDLGPQLVPGYGPSIWHGNVAMVESTWSDLNRQYQAEIETDLGTVIAVGRPQTALAAKPAIAATTLVDSDFVTALEQGAPAANL
jgi:hypothetical protein